MTATNMDLQTVDIPVFVWKQLLRPFNNDLSNPTYVYVAWSPATDFLRCSGPSINDAISDLKSAISQGLKDPYSPYDFNWVFRDGKWIIPQAVETNTIQVQLLARDPITD